MKHVFIDANIWLSLYHFTNDDLSQFEKLQNMLGKSIDLLVPEQIYNEIVRNREAKIQDALKAFVLVAPKYPVFCKEYEEFDQLSKDLSEVIKRFNLFKNKIESHIYSQELPADRTIQIFFNQFTLIPCDTYIDKAYNRYRIGNPPGKNNTYGDAINWECLLDVVPNGEDLYVISADKDYHSLVSPDKMNPFLVAEWEKKKHSHVYFYPNLVSFINEHVKEIQLKAEEEKRKLIEDLYNSDSFYRTHTVIRLLKAYSGWTEQEIERICSALMDNPQVSWILSDIDVLGFYRSILSNINYDDLPDSATKSAIDYIRSIDYEIVDHEAERDYALEEFDKH